MLISNYSSGRLPRRTFLKGVLASAGVAASSDLLVRAAALPALADQAKPPYHGPNVIIIRFGGGARRRETIDPEATYAPFLRHELAKRGTLFTNMISA